MNYKIIHTTAYTYAEAVSLCHNIARLTPRTTDRQLCKSSSVTISPQPDVVSEYEDFFGNKVIYFAIQEDHEKLTVTVTSYVNQLTKHIPSPELYAGISWEQVRDMIKAPAAEHFEAKQFVAETPMTAWNNEIAEYALKSFTPGRPIFDATLDLNTRIYKDFKFQPGFTTITTPVADVIKQRKGVCQDFAHLAIACIRSLGLPVRYMSGYIETKPAPGKEKLAGADASHAWFSIYVPDAGWLDFDPTNNQIPSTQHITVGWGRDYFDITPLKGVILSSGMHKLDVSVDMKRV